MDGDDLGLCNALDAMKIDLGDVTTTLGPAPARPDHTVSVESVGVLLDSMCLCTLRCSCERCVLGGLSMMVENMLELGPAAADTSLVLDPTTADT